MDSSDFFREFVTETEKSKNKNFNLCFEGGGVRGLVYAGVKKALEEYSIESSRYVGSSAGSIFAGLLACNADSKFLIDKIKTTDFSYFMDGWGWKLGLAYRSLWKMGMYNGDYFLNWYGELLQELTGDKDISLEEIHTKFSNDIIVTTTDLNSRKTCYISRKNHPGLPLRQAVRMSMSIPVFYVPVSFKGRVYVDGGYLDNYPIDYLDIHYPKEEVLGFVLKGDPENYKIDSWNSFMTGLLESATAKIEEYVIREDDITRTVAIPTGNVVCTDFNLSQDVIESLVISGYDTTKKFLESLV